ncbi:MAG: tetratricopeptide repeat protein, partial [Melioribacteraceae bacterium]|nr:tetratricopeptide repeat protein [Melioribacteraceae bacterium]
GIRELKTVAENGKYAKYEAQYFLMTLNYSFERNDTECFKYAKMLSDRFTDNPRFQSFLGRINIRMNDYPTAIEIFENIVDKGNKNLIGYNDKIKREAHYYIGVNYKTSDSLELALHHFKKCEQISRKIDDDEESGFLINAVLFAGEIYDRKDEREKAINHYEEVLDFREFGNSHERAEEHLEKPFIN